MKNEHASALGRLSQKSQRKKPGYKKRLKEIAQKGNETQIKQRIRKCIKYLTEHGYKVEGLIIKVK